MARPHPRPYLCRGGISASIVGPEWRYNAYAAAVRRTQLNSCFCVDEEMARAARRRFLETFADSPVMVIPAHFPNPTAGWIRSRDGSFRCHFDRDGSRRW